MVGVGRNLRGVLKVNQSLGGDLLSKLCHKTRGMDAITFSKLHKLLLRVPRSCVSYEQTAWGRVRVLQEEEGG